MAPFVTISGREQTGERPGEAKGQAQTTFTVTKSHPDVTQPKKTYTRNYKRGSFEWKICAGDFSKAGHSCGHFKIHEILTAQKGVDKTGPFSST